MCIQKVWPSSYGIELCWEGRVIIHGFLKLGHEYESQFPPSAPRSLFLFFYFSSIVATYLEWAFSLVRANMHTTNLKWYLWGQSSDVVLCLALSTKYCCNWVLYSPGSSDDSITHIVPSLSILHILLQERCQCTNKYPFNNICKKRPNLRHISRLTSQISVVVYLAWLDACAVHYHVFSALHLVTWWVS